MPDNVKDLSKRLYVRKYNEWQTIFNTDMHSKRTLETHHYKDAIALPEKNTSNPNLRSGGIVDKNFNFLAGIIRDHKRYPGNGSVYKGYEVPREEIEYVKETVLYGGHMINHIGHMLLECIASRLWWVIKNPESKAKIIFTVRQPFSAAADFFYEFMELLDIPKERVLIIERPTQFSEVIVPNECIHSYGEEFTDEYMLVFNKMKEKVRAEKYEKIFISRTHFKKNDIVNCEYFDNFFKSKGFYIAQMDRYTIKEKIGLMMGAKEVVSTMGTDSHWPIFCDPETKLVVLSRVDSHALSLQSITNQAAGLDCYVVDVSLNFLYQQHALWHNLLGVTKHWKQYVKDIYGEEISETPENTLKEKSYEYICNWLGYYANPAVYNSAGVPLKNLDAFDIINEMHRVILGSELDRSKYNIGATKIQLQKQVQDLNAQKNKFTAQVNALTEENKGLKSTQAQNEAEIAQLHSSVNELNAELLDAHRQKDEADKKFIELYQQKDEVYQKLLAAAEEKTALASEVSVKNHQIDIFLSEKDKLTANIAAKESELLIAGDKVQSLENECAVLRNKISEMENARSWRYTKPLRKNKKES